MDIIRPAGVTCNFERQTIEFRFAPEDAQYVYAMAKTKIEKEISFNSLVCGLKPGECVSKVRALDSTTPISRTPEELPEIRQQVRSACMPAVTKAKAETGGEYTVEVGDVIMPGGTIYVVAVVTRKDD